MDARKAALALAFTLLGSSAQASNFSYTFLQGNIGATEFDDSITIGNETYDSLLYVSGTGSYQSEEGVTLEASANRGVNDGNDSEITATEVSVAGGYPFAVTDSIDIYPQVGFLRSSAEVCYRGTCADTSDSGGVAALGTRAWLTRDRLEIGARVARTTLDDADTSMSFNVGWWFSPDEARLSLGLSSVDESTTYSGGFRLQF